VHARTTDYAAAYVGKFPAYDDDAGPAVAWAIDVAKRDGCSITVVAPVMRNYGEGGLLAELGATFGKATPQTLGHYAHTKPVVISFWPTAKDLEQLDRASGLKALAVVPWIEEEMATWRHARGAIDLLGNIPMQAAPTISDRVVASAMRSVTLMVNLSTGVGNPRDRNWAVWAFRILKRNGHVYDPNEIRAWAMASGWEGEHARELSELAAGVLAGKAYKVGSSMWKNQIIRDWRERAAGDEEDD
jgi:hypothetical protein